eukprot:TRINITY_DN14470_c0_g1_i1.p1 TRINITY_DN14470_c0_g1~~TRINITY_DN14470_c0_g1_i1.p1  ORF type:complete len:329 (+),score=103.83 TRINITY_DN14470_c0_g1_i1:76-1062(+)
MFSRLPPLPSVADLVKLYGVTAKQQLSQNFIFDSRLAQKFAEAGKPLKNKIVIEVGPGPGSITRGILKMGVKKLICVEKDTRFKPILQMLQTSVGKDKLELVFDDMLKLNEEELIKSIIEKEEENFISENSYNKDVPAEDNPFCLIGNLPFNIATELLLKWMRQLSNREGLFKFGNIPLILAFQTEVAERIYATPKTKKFGRLSVMTQQYADPKRCFLIKSRSFVPAPDVTATVVRIDPRLEPVVENVKVPVLELILREIFGQKRKQISNSLKQLIESKEEIHELLDNQNIKSTLRPEELTIKQWGGLSLHFQDRYGSIDYNKEKTYY